MDKNEEKSATVEETGEPEAEVVAPGPDKKLVGKGKAAPLQLNIADGSVADVPQFGGGEGEPGIDQEPVADFTKEDAILLSQSIWNIPGAILGEHLEPDQKMVERFGEQLYGYCKRKEVNLWDYAFEELPLMISGGTLAAAMVKSQLQHMAEEKKKKEEEEEGEKENVD
jgi:hypothetical protein